ncbi:sodium/glutamate symporter [Treponema pedis]|nr:sodium/glutamate symporter [Treponema pedis]
MTISMNMVETIGFSVILLILGRFLRKRVSFFSKYCIPAPVIGGFLFAILHLVLRSQKIMYIEFDDTLRPFFMTIFFTTVGFNASIDTLKKGGLMTAKFLAAAIILAALQNVIAVVLAPVLKIHPLLALMTGAAPMTGGHGTAAGIAPTVEAMGMTGAEAVAIAAATFGLLAGSLLGGPIANRLINKYKFSTKHENIKILVDDEEVHADLNASKFLNAFFYILITMWLGIYVSRLIGKTGLLFPTYIGAMVVGVILRNVFENTKLKVPMNEVAVLSDVSLTLFLAMALMTLKLWELASLAIPMVILLLAQVILAVVFIYFITFRIMGKNYDSAVLCAGHCGFGMGATPNGMANMQSVCERFGDSKVAFFVLPLVGSLFIDFFNGAQITLFINLFK